MKDGRRQQSEKSIHAILAAATQQFGEKGYDGARVDVIAREAGVNKAALYYHFGDKETLYEQVLTEVIGQMAEGIRRDAIACASAEAKLLSMIRNLASNVGQHQYFAVMMLREMASGCINLPKEVLAQIASLFNVLKNILEEGVLAGQFRQVSPFVVHMQIVGGMLFFVSSEPARRKMVEAGMAEKDVLFGDRLEDIANELAQVILEGLRYGPERAGSR